MGVDIYNSLESLIALHLMKFPKKCKQDALYMKTFIVRILVCIALQFILFIPFYRIWKKDYKEIGKHKLAVPLHERFLMWLILCPIWAVPFLRLAK